MATTVLVIDPGHGGALPVGGSSPNRASGPNGLLEKDLALDIAQRLEKLLSGAGEVYLTRASDTNLSLTARARAARDRNAALFLSLHLNGSEIAASEGCEAWIAREASPASRSLAEALAGAIASAAGTPNRGVRQRDLGVLLPSRHARQTAACLLELDYLTNPARARYFADGSYRQKIAEAMNVVLRRHLNPLSIAQAVVGAGRAEVDCPLLNSHGAASKNLILRWNLPQGHLELLDVAVHFHGFSGPVLSLTGKEQTSGLDPANRTRPLLGFVPRGKNIGEVKKLPGTYRYDFPELTNSSAKGLEDLVVFGLDWLARNELNQSAGSLKSDRRILTAHSGGGARMLKVIPFHKPDEVMFFDAIYESPDSAVKWVTLRIPQDAAALATFNRPEQWRDFMTKRGGALRSLVNPKYSDLKLTTVLHEAIECELKRIADSGLRDFLSRYYRVEKSALEHSDIPKTFGPQLLKDASADLIPAVTRLPAPAKCATAKASAMEDGDAPCIPARPSDAKTGRELVKLLFSESPPKDWVKRENIFFDEITSGNIPAFLRAFKEVQVSFREKNATGHTGIYKVMPDVLCIGSDADYFRVPLDAITAQRVADAFCCLLPTAKMVWDTYQKADIKAVFIYGGYNEPKSKIKGTSMAAYAEHSNAITAALPLDAKTKLVEGHKKMVVISNSLYRMIPRKKKDGTTEIVDGKKLLAFYGWFKKDGTPVQGGPNGIVSLAHEPSFADYSQGVRLVHPMMTVDGTSMAVRDVLADPVLHPLLSNEGPVKKPRIPGKR